MNLSSYRLNSISEVLPLYEENPGRFMRFYNTIYLLLCNIPPLGSIRVADHCQPASYSIFVKCVCLCILEERHQSEEIDRMLEFSDDYTEIRRSGIFRKFVYQNPFYQRRKE